MAGEGEQRFYDLERNLIRLFQADEYQACFKLVEEALIDPNLDPALTRRMLVPIAYNIARIAGNATLMTRYLELSVKRVPRRGTGGLLDAT